MATRAEVEVLPTREALMEAAAARFVSAAGTALRASGRFVVALAGGSTPKALYALLAGAPWAGRVDWSRVHVFWGDERCVPPDDPASNYRMACEALLAHVPVSERNVHRIRGEDDPRRAAAAYERVLRETFATPVGPPRRAPGARFDLVLLGMGDNGHTASLFPGGTAVRETERWVVAERVDVTGRSLNWPRYSRISLTSGLTVITMVLSLAKCGVTTRRTPIFFSSYPLSRRVPESWACS